MSVQRDIDAELRFHFDARIEELVGQGMSHDAAHTRAIAEFGDVETTRANLHEIASRVARRRDRGETIDALRQDLRFAFRSLRRTPAVSLTIILTLALGLGANAMMFSLLETIYLRPPAGLASPGELRRVWTEQKFRTGPAFTTHVDYSAYAAIVRALDGHASVAVYRADPRKLGTGEAASTIRVAGATANYFSVLGVKPALGRFYTPQEDEVAESARVAVISDALWRSRFAGDPKVLGQPLTLGTDKFTIIGVTPPGFRGVDLDVTDAWMPVATELGPGVNWRGPWWKNENINGFQVVLRPLPSARLRELPQRVTAALRQPDVGGWRLDSTAVAAFGSINAARGPGKASAEMQVATRLAGVAVIVLLIACANIINLLLARALSRRREIAVRLALGVSRSRLIALIVTESVLLSLVAGAGAIAAAQWGGALMRALLMPDVGWAESPLDWRVLLFALAAALIAGTLAGLVPALRSASPDVLESLRAGARDATSNRSRLRGFLVTMQAALSVVLLVGAVLFVRSLRNVQEHDFGYAVPQLAFATVKYDARDAARDSVVASRIRALESRIASMPGVERVALTSFRPKSGFSTTRYFPDADTATHKKPGGFITAVSPSYFEAAGTRLLRGHTFEAGTASGFATIVNQAMADALWPNQDPIGRCVRFDKPSAPCATIIGVVQTAMMLSVDEPATPRFYVSVDNLPLSMYIGRDLVVRAEPRRLPQVMTAVRDLLRMEFPGSIPQITMMSQAMEPDYRPWELGAKLFTLFGVLALIVAAIGVYSTVSYAVSRRTQEFGIRIALGAQTADVLRQVLGEGMRTVVLGVLAGVGLALAAGKLVASLLYGIKPNDPVAMVVVAAMLLAIAIVASLVPALRATRADPVSALRAD